MDFSPLDQIVETEAVEVQVFDWLAKSLVTYS